MDSGIFVIAMFAVFMVMACAYNKINNVKSNLIKASTALGDTTHTLGVPNTPWKDLGISYQEYQMVVGVLAQSGDFSVENVQHCLNGIDRTGSGIGTGTYPGLDSQDNHRPAHGIWSAPIGTDSSHHRDTAPSHADHGSDFGDPFSTNNLSPTNAFLGDSLHVISNDHSSGSDI